jgi:hypothetical protein
MNDSVEVDITEFMVYLSTTMVVLELRPNTWILTKCEL